MTELRIRNFAIIEDIGLEFSDGFTVLTGETGAGKSILVDAVDLLVGGRASADAIRTGAEEAEISGVFDVGGNVQVLPLQDFGAAVFMDSDGFGHDVLDLLLPTQSGIFPIF